MIILKIQAYLYKKCCKQQYSKEALSWYNFNPKGMITFPYDDKQIVLLTSMRNNSPELQYTVKKDLTISPTARLKSHVLALSNYAVDEFSSYWSKSRELGGKGSPRFPCVTPVVGSSSSELLRAIISYCAGSHLEFFQTYCQRYMMELFCGSSQRS